MLRLTGHGTDIIKIKGVKNCQDVNYKVMPDRIEAGTFALLLLDVQAKYFNKY